MTGRWKIEERVSELPNGADVSIPGWVETRNHQPEIVNVVDGTNQDNSLRYLFPAPLGNHKSLRTSCVAFADTPNIEYANVTFSIINVEFDHNGPAEMNDRFAPIDCDLFYRFTIHVGTYGNPDVFSAHVELGRMAWAFRSKIGYSQSVDSRFRTTNNMDFVVSKTKKELLPRIIDQFTQEFTLEYNHNTPCIINVYSNGKYLMCLVNRTGVYFDRVTCTIDPVVSNTPTTITKSINAIKMKR